MHPASATVQAVQQFRIWVLMSEWWWSYHQNQLEEDLGSKLILAKWSLRSDRSPRVWFDDAFLNGPEWGVATPELLPTWPRTKGLGGEMAPVWAFEEFRRHSALQVLLHPHYHSMHSFFPLLPTECWSGPVLWLLLIGGSRGLHDHQSRRKQPTHLLRQSNWGLQPSGEICYVGPPSGLWDKTTGAKLRAAK